MFGLRFSVHPFISDNSLLLKSCKTLQLQFLHEINLCTIARRGKEYARGLYDAWCLPSKFCTRKQSQACLETGSSHVCTCCCAFYMSAFYIANLISRTSCKASGSWNNSMWLLAKRNPGTPNVIAHGAGLVLCPRWQDDWPPFPRPPHCPIIPVGRLCPSYDPSNANPIVAMWSRSWIQDKLSLYHS